jgi:hypothetical protein
MVTTKTSAYVMTSNEVYVQHIPKNAIELGLAASTHLLDALEILKGSALTAPMVIVVPAVNRRPPAVVKQIVRAAMTATLAHHLYLPAAWRAELERVAVPTLALPSLGPPSPTSLSESEVKMTPSRKPASRLNPNSPAFVPTQQCTSQAMRTTTNWQP